MCVCMCVCVCVCERERERERERAVCIVCVSTCEGLEQIVCMYGMLSDDGVRMHVISVCAVCDQMIVEVCLHSVPSLHVPVKKT